MPLQSLSIPPYSEIPTFLSTAAMQSTSLYVQNDVDASLADLLHSMNIGAQWMDDVCMDSNANPLPAQDAISPPSGAPDVHMMHHPDLSLHQIPSTESSALCSSSDEPTGCAMLQVFSGQLLQDSFATTAGVYLDVISMHREVFSAYPRGHRTCAKGFTDLASMLERRAWRADREGDTEAVAAFRSEARVIDGCFEGPGSTWTSDYY